MRVHVWVPPRFDRTLRNFLVNCYLIPLNSQGKLKLELMETLPISGRCPGWSFCFTPHLGFPESTVVKNLPANAGDVGDVGLIPGSGRSPRVRNGNPHQYSCLENSMYRGAWWVTIHGPAKRWMRLSTHRMQSLQMGSWENWQKPTKVKILASNRFLEYQSTEPSWKRKIKFHMVPSFLNSDPLVIDHFSSSNSCYLFVCLVLCPENFAW